MVMLLTHHICACHLWPHPPHTHTLQIRGVFNGAALVFFSYIGFDAVACSAEEVGVSVFGHCRPVATQGGGIQATWWHPGRMWLRVIKPTVV